MHKGENLYPFLSEMGEITPEQIQEAFDYSQNNNIHIDESLVYLGFANMLQIGNSLSKLFGLPYHPLTILPELSPIWRIIPHDTAKQLQLYPFELTSNNILKIAVPHPYKIPLVKSKLIDITTDYTCEFSIASNAEINTALWICKNKCDKKNKTLPVKSPAHRIIPIEKESELPDNTPYRIEIDTQHPDTPAPSAGDIKNFFVRPRLKRKKENTVDKENLLYSVLGLSLTTTRMLANNPEKLKQITKKIQ